MGYTFGFAGVREVVEELTTGDAAEGLVAWNFAGNVLWSVRKINGTNVVFCDLIDTMGGTYGFKTLDESVGPRAYGCPLEFLAMAPVVNPEWRAEVASYQEEN